MKGTGGGVGTSSRGLHGVATGQRGEGMDQLTDLRQRDTGRALSMEIVFGWMKIPAITVWERLYAPHRARLDDAGDFHVDTRTRACPARDVGKYIRRSADAYFGLTLNERLVFDFGNVTNYNLSFVSIHDFVTGPDDAQAWLEPFLSEPAFIQARLVDDDYEFWQNAADFLHYEVRGRSLEGLPTRSNGLPAPLTRTVVDTSSNPGRRVLRNGYVEAVASPMWLGAPFWPLVGRNKEDVCGMDAWRCADLGNGVTRIDAPGGIFTSADGPSGDLQRRLRAALYPELPA